MSLLVNTQPDLGREILYRIYREKPLVLKECIRNVFFVMSTQLSEFEQNQLVYRLHEHRFIPLQYDQELRAFQDLSADEKAENFKDYECSQLKALAHSIIAKSELVLKTKDEKTGITNEKPFECVVETLSNYLTKKICLTVEEQLKMKTPAKTESLTYAQKVREFPHFSPKLMKLLAKILDGNFLSFEEKIRKKEMREETENKSRNAALTEEEKLTKELEESNKKLQKRRKAVNDKLSLFSTTTILEFPIDRGPVIILGEYDSLPIDEEERPEESENAEELPEAPGGPPFQFKVKIEQRVELDESAEDLIEKPDELVDIGVIGQINPTSPESTVEIIINKSDKSKSVEGGVKAKPKTSTCLRFWNWLKNLPGSLGRFIKHLFFKPKIRTSDPLED
jgi:hypothetical protein